MKFSRLLLAALAGFSVNAGAAVLAGDVVDAEMIRTIDEGPYGYPQGRLLGYGLDAPFTVTADASDVKQYSSAFSLDVNDTSFTLQFLDYAGWQQGIVFRLSGLDFLDDRTGFLSSLDVNTNLSGYSLTLSPHTLEIGLGGTQFTPSTYFTGTFNVAAPVPEPSIMAMMCLGVAGVGAVAKRKRQRQQSA